nr:RNA-directed DNA polymerase, eukaryota [Tanacetum cinerariifolium]
MDQIFLHLIDHLDPLMVRPPANAKTSAPFGGNTQPSIKEVKANSSSQTGRSSHSTNPGVAKQPKVHTERDLSRHVMGKVKDFSSIPNLYTILTDEGFSGAKLTYMGGTWVMIEFDKVDTKEHLMNHSGIKSWFLEIKEAVDEFELFTWNPIFMIHKENDCNSDGGSAIEPLNNNDNEEEFDDEYASDVNEVPDTVFRENASSNLRSNDSVKVHQSEDPFGLYDLLNKKKAGETEKSSPPFLIRLVSQKGINNGGSVLGVMKDVIRVGQAMGYSMEGYVKDLVAIIGKQGEENVFR